jgi:hypothetical protein
MKAMKQCLFASEGQEITFLKEVEIRINHYLNLDHSQCYWENHKTHETELSLEAKSLYMVSMNVFLNCLF